MVVKVGGMCWVISTGKRSITGPMSVTSDISACGPPVEEPITSARGAVMPNCRRTSGAAGAAGAGFACGCGRPSTGASGGLVTCVRRTFAPRWRIFWIRSWWKMSAAATSRVLSGFGM